MLSLHQIANIAAYTGNTLVTFAVGSPNGIGKKYGFKDNKTISDAHPTLVTPNGYAFAIWGPIFALEGAFTVWQCFHGDNKILMAASPYWWAACGLQAAWTIAFSAEQYAASVPLLFGITAALYPVYRATSIIAARDPSRMTTYVCAALPFALHFSWAACASLVNANLAAVALGASPATQLLLGGLSTAAAALGAAATTLVLRDPVPALVGAWALLAISNKPRPAVLVENFPPSQLTGMSTAARWLGYGLLGLGGLMVAGLAPTLR